MRFGDCKTFAGIYWIILNRLIYNKKIPAIPPLFVVGNSISDFCVIGNNFNNYFASVCTPIKNASVLPPFSYKTNTRINSFKVTESDISIIKSLDSTKAHGCVVIKMIRMIKM